MNGTPQGLDDLSLGELLVRQGFVTFNQVHECLLLQKSQQQKKLGDILMEHGYVRPDQLQLVLDLQLRGRSASKIVIPGYDIYEKIGHGAMGAVYRARQLSVDRPVALKVLSGQLSSDKTFVERFLREARSVAELSHPNIVAGIDAGEIGGLHYYVMEYIDGVTAQEMLRARGSVPEADCARIGTAVSQALDHASHHGIIHRDIKPQNIMIGREGAVKLCDLGLAKRLGHSDPSLTADGIAIGTPYYISPELARGEHNVDIRSDIYSLGATLYHLATGQPPFLASNYAAILEKHVAEIPLHPRRIKPELSEEFCRVVLRCLEKKPADRYLHPSQLAADFQELSAHRSNLSPLPKPTGRRVTTADRKPTHVSHSRIVMAPRRDRSPTYALAGLLALAGVLLLFILLSRPSAPPRPPSAIVDRGSDLPEPGPNPVEVLFGRRSKEFRELRDTASLSKCYEFLLKCTVEFTSTSYHSHWQKEIDLFESETNERILRLHWTIVAERAAHLRSQGKLVAALETVDSFPQVHRYFIYTPEQQRMTAAGELAKRLGESLLREIESLVEPILNAYHSFMVRLDYGAALAETDRLVPLAYGAARQGQIDDLRETVLIEIVNQALAPPIKPKALVDAKEKVGRFFERYKTGPRVALQIEHQLMRLEDSYVEELKQASDSLEASYPALVQKPFDRYLLERRYPDARRLALRLFQDPAHANIQTALYLDAVDYSWLFRQLEQSRAELSEYPKIVKKLEEFLAVANARDSYTPLGRLLADIRAAFLLEWFVERAAAQLTPDIKSIKHPDFAAGRVAEVLRVAADGVLFRIKLTGGSEKQASLAPLTDGAFDADDVVQLARQNERAIADPYFDLQAALMILFCVPVRENDVLFWSRRMTDWSVKAAWSQYEARLKTLPKENRSAQPTLESIFTGSVKILDAKKNRVEISYDFSNPRQLEDFEAVRARSTGSRFTMAASNGLIVDGNGIALWKGSADGILNADITLVPTSGKNLVLLIGSPDRQTGYALCLDCSVGNTELTPGKPVRADHGMALVRLPMNESHPLLASQRLTGVLPGPFAPGKPVKVRLALSDQTLKAQVEGLKGSTAMVSLEATKTPFGIGTFGIWTWGSDAKITSLKIETTLNDKWVADQLSR